MPIRESRLGVDELYFTDGHYDLMQLGEMLPDVLEYAGEDKELVTVSYEALRRYLEGKGLL